MKLNWALDKKHAEEPELLDPGSREIVWFDIIDLLKQTRQSWTIDPNKRKCRNEIKIEKAKKHFEDGGWMDPGYIRYIRPDGYILVEGKHRMVAAIQLGETYAPFTMPKEWADDLKSMIITRDL